MNEQWGPREQTGAVTVTFLSVLTAVLFLAVFSFLDFLHAAYSG
jgi:hypothetical protein